MCLAIPGQVLEVYEANGARMGRVDFGGITKEICLTFVPEATVGDYAIVHAGFALTRVDEQSALESLATFRELGVIEEELGMAEPPGRPAGEPDTP